MAIPHFAKTVAEAGVVTMLTTLPTNILYATGTWNVLNTGTEVALIRLGWGSGNTMQLVDHLDHGTQVQPKGGIVIRACSIIAPGSKIFVFSDKPDVVFNFTALSQELIEAM